MIAFLERPLFYRTHPFRPSLVRRKMIFQIKQPSIFTSSWQQRRLCSLFSRLLPSPIPKAQKVPQWSIHERECPKLCCVCWKAPKEKIARFRGEKKAVLFNIEMQTFILLPNLAKAKIECEKKTIFPLSTTLKRWKIDACLWLHSKYIILSEV